MNLLRAPAAMKFSYRVIALMFLGCSLVSFYFIWNDEWMDIIASKSGMKKPVRARLEKSFPASTVTRSTPLTFHQPSDTKIGSINYGECDFTNNTWDSADIDTFDIFQSVDNEKMTTSRRGKHMEQFRSNSAAATSKKLPLKIFLVPHSHNDPGWHKTVDGYFHDQTKPTLDNMVEKLTKFPNMTFVWAESIFLHMWFQKTSAADRQQVRNLIKRRQLEIVSGSWVVPDEANPHYFALVDQMIEGHQWLEEHLDIKPRNTWTLDPFGYSSTHPYLYKQAGYENMVILRVHEKLKENLQNKKALEFFWHQYWDKDNSSDIFTQMMPFRLYNIKHTCGPDTHVCVQFDFRKIPGEYSESRAEPITSANVERYAKLLIGQYQIKANMFRHNVVLIPLGDDFRFDRPVEWDQQYKNYMMLFNYINKRTDWNVQARFGVLQDYFDEVKQRVEKHPLLQATGFPTLQGDFFPYTDENNEYWAGYFTTRPYDKNMGREVEVHLRAAEILNTLAQGSAMKTGRKFLSYETNMKTLPSARQDLGLFQHHDAITGTARSFVVIDYELRLKNALSVAKKVMVSATEYLLKTANVLSSEPKSFRMLHPEDNVLKFDDNGKADVVLFNSVVHRRKELVKVTVRSDRVEVFDSDGQIVPSQVNPIWKTFTDVSTTEFELLFYAELPELSLVTYKVVETSSNPSSFAANVRLYNADEFRLPSQTRFTLAAQKGEDIELENGAYKARFSPRTGLLHSVTTKQNKPIRSEMNMEFLMYKSRGSGAYIFNPAGPAVDTEMSTRPIVRIVKGPLASEIHLVQELISSTVRLCNTTGIQGQAIEIENVVDIKKKQDRELIMRITTDMKHNGTFYTDLNAFQIMKRKRFLKMPPEANYYPTSSLAYIEDSQSRLNLISAQPLGVSSQSEGSLEIMLDRRLSSDDNRGLGEGVWDNKPSPSRFYLLIEHPEKSSKPSPHFPSLLAHQLINNLRNYVFTMSAPNATLMSFRPLTAPFPCDIELTNLRALKGNSAALIVHRVGYTCGFPTPRLGCGMTNGSLSSPKDLFTSMKIKSSQPTSLSLMYNVTRSSYLEPMELYAYKVFY